MARFNLDDFRIAKVDETGGTYYYYLYVKPKDHALSDTNCAYILRTNVAGTEFEYVFVNTTDSDALWTAKATQVFKDLNQW